MKLEDVEIKLPDGCYAIARETVGGDIVLDHSRCKNPWICAGKVLVIEK